MCINQKNRDEYGVLSSKTVDNCVENVDLLVDAVLYIQAGVYKHTAIDLSILNSLQNVFYLNNPAKTCCPGRAGKWEIWRNIVG